MLFNETYLATYSVNYSVEAALRNTTVVTRALTTVFVSNLAGKQIFENFTVDASHLYRNVSTLINSGKFIQYTLRTKSRGDQGNMNPGAQ